MSAIVTARGIHKRFGPHTVFEDLDLSIEQGQLFALIGPSGAGKSTLVRILCGLLRPDAGVAHVLGWRVPNFRIRSQLGYMPQDTALYPDLTVWQNLSLFGELYDVPRDQLRGRADALLALLELGDARRRRVADLSGGMQRRVSLIASLLHKPRLLFLDEPTVGLDPHLRQVLWRHFADLGGEGVTLVVTTHHMEEAERCQRVGLLSGGRLLAEGAPDELMQETGADGLEGAFMALQERGRA